jgi:hypothetical protein
MKHQLSFRSTIPERNKWIQGAIKLVDMVPPVPLPEYDPENLPDIEIEEHTLPPDPVSPHPHSPQRKAKAQTQKEGPFT